MIYCYNCGCHLSKPDFCTSCGADVTLYKKVMHISNMYYNEGLEKAGVRDLTGAVVSLRQSLKFNKNNLKARNLLGLVYFEMGEVVTALSEWVISKNIRPEKNIADEYIEKVRSNSTRLESINQTIKKYNRSLALCCQGSKDLAVIQLKKVLSMNPRFIRAHQLLALLYMDGEDWERAERELRKCMDIDKNNLQTMRYLKEVEAMLMPDEGVKQPAKRRKEEAIRYQSENELIIRPVNVKEPKRSGMSTLVNLAIGLIIGMAGIYFLVVPAAQSKVRNEDQQIITKISSESDTKIARIQELENQITKLQADMEALHGQIDGFVGQDGTLQSIERLLAVSAGYLESRDVFAAEAELLSIGQSVDLGAMTEGYGRLYQAVFAAIKPELATSYFTQGSNYYKIAEYAEAVSAFQKAVEYNAEDIESLFMLGEAYRMGGDTENAIATYDKVMELFPGTWRANSAKQSKSRLTGIW